MSQARIRTHLASSLRLSTRRRRSLQSAMGPHCLQGIAFCQRYSVWSLTLCLLAREAIDSSPRNNCMDDLSLDVASLDLRAHCCDSSVLAGTESHYRKLGFQPTYCRRSFFASASINRWSSATCEYTASIIFVSLWPTRAPPRASHTGPQFPRHKSCGEGHIAGIAWRTAWPPW